MNSDKLRMLQIIAFCLVLFVGLTLTGCATPFAKLDRHIPDGNWKTAHVALTGEMVNGSITASGKKEKGKWVDGKIHAEYNGFWLKRAELDLEVDSVAK